MLTPTSANGARWDAAMGILIVWSIILVPLNIAFRNENPATLPDGSPNSMYVIVSLFLSFSLCLPSN